MKQNKYLRIMLLLLGCGLVGILVAITYFLFEHAVHASINFIWITKANSSVIRLLVVPLCVVLSLLFFGLQHFLDPASEKHELHGLGGGTITPTIRNLLIILVLGFFSLVAGASLGPEAVLVPASVIVGSYVGYRLFKKDQVVTRALAAAAIMALMAAFFNSFFVGVLAIFLVKKQTKTKLSPLLVAIAIVASASSVATLKLIDPNNNYFNFPAFSLRVALIDLLLAVVLIAVGYMITFALKYTHAIFDRIKSSDILNKWWLIALVAGIILSGLYFR